MGKFQTAPIFTNGMVLQRSRNICIFGTGDEGTEVIGELCGFRSSCTVTNGKWKIVFPPMGACRFVILKLYDADNDNVIRIENVAIGEVWLAGGQSNMELELCNCKGGKEALENDDTKDVRYYYVPKKTIYDEDYEENMQNAKWTDFSDKDAAAHWSAVGYYFAKEMSQYLDVTVGVIGCNWGGTSASCWIQREYATGDTKVYFDDYDAAIEGKDINQLISDYREYEKYQQRWWEKSGEYYASEGEHTWDGCLEYCMSVGPDRYPGPMAPCNPTAPGILYESMVSRVLPYTLGGVLWYQGETDETHPDAYYTLLTQLIRNWREAWGDDELPFIIGQLPMYAGGSPDGDSWSRIREAQMRAYKTIKNTGIAVLLDCGERDDIHPKDKQPVGHRFAMQALDMVYGGCDGAFAPTLKNVIWRGDMVELQFANARGGFKVKGEPEGFEMCGEDGVYIPVYADVSGERIFLSDDAIERPCGVRYLWKNYADIHIFSGFGLPLAPFRIKK